MIFFFLFLTQYESLQFPQCCFKCRYFVLLMTELHSIMYIYHIFLIHFICRWVFRLFLFLGYCEQCCSEHRDACIFFNERFFWIYAQEWDCQVIWQFYIQFSEVPPYCFPQWLYQFIFPPTVQEVSLFSSLAFVICRHIDDGHSHKCEVVLRCCFDLQFSNQ